jgi:hypothetical protein
MVPPQISQAGAQTANSGNVRRGRHRLLYPPAVLDHAGALAQGDNGIGPDLLRLILFQLCYPFRDEAIQLSVGECLQPWTILFLNHSHGKR